MATTGYAIVWFPLRGGYYPPEVLHDLWDIAGGLDELDRELVRHIANSVQGGGCSAYIDRIDSYSMVVFGSQYHGVPNEDSLVPLLKKIFEVLTRYGVLHKDERIRLVICDENWDDDPKTLAPGYTISIGIDGAFEHIGEGRWLEV